MPLENTPRRAGVVWIEEKFKLIPIKFFKIYFCSTTGDSKTSQALGQPSNQALVFHCIVEWANTLHITQCKVWALCHSNSGTWAKKPPTKTRRASIDYTLEWVRPLCILSCNVQLKPRVKHILGGRELLSHPNNMIYMTWQHDIHHIRSRETQFPSS